MNDLRLILLLLGVAIIAGLYLRERLARRRRDAREREEPDTIEEPGFNLYTGSSREEDVGSAISVLKRDTAREDDTLEPLMRTDRGASRQPESAEVIITLHVVAAEGDHFRGPAVLRAVRQQELRFGDMNIFHHYGIGDMRTSQPLFHLANMLEPGVFDLDSMHGFETRGLSLFMRLPAPLNAQVVFDLMLNTASRLAEDLGGQLQTHDHQPLTGDRIQELYNRIERLEQGDG